MRESREYSLDLNKHLIKHPAATFFVSVKGDSMIDAGIHYAADKRVVIAVVDGEFTVKRIRRVGEKVYLMPENSEYNSTEITESMNFTIWGVVTNVVHAL